MVDIYVGEGRRHWALHRNLLCHHSRFFETKLTSPADHKNEYHQSSNYRLELLDTDPAAFELLVKYLYQGKIDDVSSLPLSRKWQYADTCWRLHLLCQRLQLPPSLKNAAMDQFRKGCYEAGLVPGAEEMIPIYEGTEQGSPFRKLVARIAARQIMDPENMHDAGSYRGVFEGRSGGDFAIDVVNAIKEGVGGILLDDPTEDDGCEYHEHENGDTCAKKKTKRKMEEKG